MQPKSANSAFEPLKPPQDSLQPAESPSAEFEGTLESASFESRSAMIAEPLKPPQ